MNDQIKYAINEYKENYLDYEKALNLYITFQNISLKELPFIVEYIASLSYSNELVLRGIIDILSFTKYSYKIFIQEFNKLTVDNKNIMIDELKIIDNTDVFNYNYYYQSKHNRYKNSEMQHLIYEYLFVYDNNKFNEFLKQNLYVLDYEYTKFAMPYIFSFISNHKKSVTFLIKAISKHYNPVYKELIENAYYGLSDKQKEICAIYFPKELEYLISLAEIFTERKKFQDNIPLAVRVITREIKDFSEKKKIEVISDFGKLFTLKGFEKEVTTFFDLIPFSNIFLEYLLYRGFFNFPIAVNKSEDILKENYKHYLNIKDKNFNLYFDISAKCEIADHNGEFYIIENYQLTLKDGTICIDVYNNYEETYFQATGGLGYQNRYLVYYMISYANLYDQAFLEEKKNAEIKRQEFIFAKEKSIYLDIFNKIEESNLKESTKTLNNELLVGLEYHIEANQYNDYYDLFLKIGNTKLYTVTNIGKFFSNFLFNEEQRYGKELTFVHNLDNIKEIDHDALSFLQTLSYSSGSKYIQLDLRKLLKLFSLLKGRIIYFNDVPYKLELTKVTRYFRLSKDYELYLELHENEISLINDKQPIIFDNENHTINYLYVTHASTELLNLCLIKTPIQIKPVLKEFKERIYPILKDLIVLDDEIKDEFKVSYIDISSYFDYDNKIIKLKTIYNKDNEEITDLNSLPSYDKSKILRYFNSIDELGFTDNEIKDEDKILNFLKLDFTKLKELTKVFLSDNLINKQLTPFKTPKIRMDYNNNMMDVFLKDSIYSDEELYQILAAIKKKKKFILLKGDKIVSLDTPETHQFYETVNDLNLDTKKLSNKLTLPLYQTLKAFSHLDNVDIDDYLVKIVDDIKNFKKKTFKLPTLNATLRKYQQEGFNWLKILSNYNLSGILADDMGLGKTLEIISLIASSKENKPSLIVVPKSLIFNWIKEFNTFADYLNVISIYGSTIERQNIINSINKNDNHIYITSYDSLRNDIDNYKVTFNYLILDEAQYIKNINAKKTKSVKTLNALHRFALTGTPIENDIFDLYSIFDFVMPNYLPQLKEFKERAKEETFQNMIKKRVAPFILRRTKKEVLKDLPPKYERIITAEMTEEQRKLYDAYILDAQNVLKEDGKTFDVLKMLTRLRQICVDPNVFIDSFEGTSGKMNILQELIKDYISNGHRILIFSQFVKVLDIIEEHLLDDNIKYFKLTGKTDGEERINLVNQFNENSNVKVFLISLKAGGNGLNLVGADTVIHVDPWWNLAAEDQATDRAYRIGQMKNVEVIKLIAENSIEQKVIELQYKKKDLIDKLISNDTSSIEKVTVDDLKFILE